MEPSTLEPAVYPAPRRHAVSPSAWPTDAPAEPIICTDSRESDRHHTYSVTEMISNIHHSQHTASVVIQNKTNHKHTPTVQVSAEYEMGFTITVNT